VIVTRFPLYKYRGYSRLAITTREETETRRVCSERAQYSTIYYLHRKVKDKMQKVWYPSMLESVQKENHGMGAFGPEKPWVRSAHGQRKRTRPAHRLSKPPFSGRTRLQERVV
jgi:hypothetical protein